VSKTGAPELATDPMGIEQTDVYISLKPREAWRPELLKEQLAEEIAQAAGAAVPEVARASRSPSRCVPMSWSRACVLMQPCCSTVRLSAAVGVG